MSCKPWVVSYTDVIDGLTFQACCPACGWEAAPTANAQVAKARLNQHAQPQGENT